MRGRVGIITCMITAMIAALVIFFKNATAAARSYDLHARLERVAISNGAVEPSDWVATWNDDDTLSSVAGSGHPSILIDERLRSRVRSGGGSITRNFAVRNGLQSYAVYAGTRADGTIRVAASPLRRPRKIYNS